MKCLIHYMKRHMDFLDRRFFGVQGKIELDSQRQNSTYSLKEIGPTKLGDKFKSAIFKILFI